MSEGGALSVRIELTKGDFRHFYARWMRKSPGIWIASAAFFLAGVIYIALAIESSFETLDWIFPALVLFYMFWFCFVFLVRLPAIQLRRPGSRPPIDISVTQSYLGYTNDFLATHVSWRAIQRIDESPTHIYMYLIGPGTYAYIVPKRFFEGPEAAQQFLETARRYLRAAQ